MEGLGFPMAKAQDRSLSVAVQDLGDRLTKLEAKLAASTAVFDNRLEAMEDIKRQVVEAVHELTEAAARGIR